MTEPNQYKREQADADRWNAWRLSRRRLIEAGAFGGLGVAVGSPGLDMVQDAAAQTPEPKMGGTVSMSLAESDVQTFDPPFAYDNMSIWTMLIVYDQLVRVNHDSTGVEPGLAERWEISEDRLTYTFYLRDAKFHDGTPVTAGDVVFSLNRLLTIEGAVWEFLYEVISDLEAIDERTVKLTVAQPWVPLEADLAMFAASILPQAAVEAQGDAFFQAPTGSGPFKFSSWKKGEELVLEKNEDFWEPGKPYLDTLRFKVITDASERVRQLRANDLDIATNVPVNQLDWLTDDPDFQIVLDSVARLDYIGLNSRRPPFDDWKLRQAVNYAVDNQAFIDEVLLGYGQIANSYLPLMLMHDDELPPYPYDLDKARSLVAESGYANGFKGELIVHEGDPVDIEVCERVASAMAEIGGDITITQLGADALLGRIYGSDHDFDMFKYYYTTDIVDPDELTAGGVLNDGGYTVMGTTYDDHDLDQLVRNTQVDFDPVSRQQTYNEIQRIVQDCASKLYLYYPTGRTALTRPIRNFSILTTGKYRMFEVWRDDIV